jgi:SAM-dependent methyltransferase
MADTKAFGEQLTAFYRERIRSHGAGYAAMWGEEAGWKTAERFRPITMLPTAPGDVVVDIGCGIGDLAMFCNERRLGIEYIGIEIVPEFAAAARQRTGAQIVEIDAFAEGAELPAADWYVTFGTLNKEWCVAPLAGTNSARSIEAYIEKLFLKARKGVGCSLVTDHVEYRKDGVANVDPAAMAELARRMTPHFLIFHGYPFYEFFAGFWRGTRGK